MSTPAVDNPGRSISLPGLAQDAAPSKASVAGRLR
jgi:hypothetical protein